MKKFILILLCLAFVNVNAMAVKSTDHQDQEKTEQIESAFKVDLQDQFKGSINLLNIKTKEKLAERDSLSDAKVLTLHFNDLFLVKSLSDSLQNKNSQLLKQRHCLFLNNKDYIKDKTVLFSDYNCNQLFLDDRSLLEPFPDIKSSFLINDNPNSLETQQKRKLAFDCNYARSFLRPIIYMS